MIGSISGKNIWRNRTRSLVVIAAIALGMCGGIVSSAVFMGMAEQRVRKALQNEVPYIQIRHPDFDRTQDPALFVSNSDAIIKWLEKIPGVQAAAAHVIWQG